MVDRLFYDYYIVNHQSNIERLNRLERESSDLRESLDQLDSLESLAHLESIRHELGIDGQDLDVSIESGSENNESNED